MLEPLRIGLVTECLALNELFTDICTSAVACKPVFDLSVIILPRTFPPSLLCKCDTFQSLLAPGVTFLASL